MTQLQVVAGHGSGRSAVDLHLVVHAAHLLVGDAAGELVQRGDDLGVVFCEILAHHRRALVCGEQMPVVLERREIVLADLGVGGIGIDDLHIAVRNRLVA